MEKENVHLYPIVIKETYLDVFGHVNNARYLSLFEDARWELITQNNYGLKTIQETGLGPVILGLEVKFLKELHARDEIVIKTEILPYKGKIGMMKQAMLRGEQVCCEAIFKFGLFDIKARKLVSFTDRWLKAVVVQ